jgi:hypothetical protein
VILLVIRRLCGVSDKRGANPRRGGSEGGADGDLLLVARNVQCRFSGVQGFAHVVRRLEQEPGRVRQFADEGRVIPRRGLGGDGLQLGVQRGGLAVQFGVVLADPFAVLRSRGASVIAELGELADQALLAGLVAGDRLQLPH